MEFALGEAPGAAVPTSTPSAGLKAAATGSGHGADGPDPFGGAGVGALGAEPFGDGVAAGVTAGAGAAAGAGLLGDFDRKVGRYSPGAEAPPL